MAKVLIIGAGFAGVSCATMLSRAKTGLEVVVIDKKDTFDFLPALPDTIGRGVNPKILAYDIKLIARENNFGFIKNEVSALDLQKREVTTAAGKINYDYLVIASGTETNFYGQDSLKDSVYTLDNVNDAVKILSMLRENWFDNFLIAGGGYTGVEVATNLRRLSLERKQKTTIAIVEKTSSILGALPRLVRDCTMKNLSRLDIQVVTKSTVEQVEGRSVYLSDMKRFENALVIWAPGVKTAPFIQNLNAFKNQQGRLNVDRYLRLDSSCFVVGDAACVKYDKGYLRMAVQFARAEGILTAANIVRSVKKQPLVEYKPSDLGFIIPMANDFSCGSVLGFNLTGKIPTSLHYMMCERTIYGKENKRAFRESLKAKK